MPTSLSFGYFKTSPEIIQLAVMLYVRFPLSLRNVEDLLHERGVDVSYESVMYRWLDSAPGNHFPKQHQRLNFCTVSLCVCVSNTHQTHTFSRVCGERFRGRTLCLQPSERTQFFMRNRFTLQQAYESNLL